MYVTVGGAGIAAPFVLHGDPWVVPELTLDTVGLWMNLDAEVEVVDGVRSIAVQDVKTLGALLEHLQSEHPKRILAMISCEFSGEKLGEATEQPQFVKNADWFKRCWQGDKVPTPVGKSSKFPQVHLHRVCI